MKHNVKYYSILVYTICHFYIVAMKLTLQQHDTDTKDRRKQKTAEYFQLPSKSAKQSPDHSHLAIRYPHRLRLEFPVDGPVQNAYSPAELNFGHEDSRPREK